MPRLGVAGCMSKPGFQMTGTTRELREDGTKVPHVDRWQAVYRSPDGRTAVGKTRTVEWHGAPAAVIGERSVELVVGESGAARWTGLHTCGSPWTCPWCAPRISDQRREQLVGALTRWRNVGRWGACAHKGRSDSSWQKGCSCVRPWVPCAHPDRTKCGCEAMRGVGMLTFTAPHTVHDSLKELRVALLAAMRRVTGHRTYRALRDELGCAGTIRATEVTYGRNGWHLHFHVVWLQERPMTEDDGALIRRTVFPLWRDACVRAGLGAPSEEHGLDVGLGSHPDEYVSKFGDVDELCPTRAPKWGAAEELTLAALKVGRGADSVNPWGLLLAAGAGDPIAARLWSEFAAAMKGAAQLVWSKGLKGKLGVDQADDIELAAREERDEVVARVPVRGDEFRALVRHGLRIRLLEVAETAYAAGDDPQVAVMVLLGQLRDYEARGDGRVDVARPVGGTPWSSS
jgi:hypothetical protein